MKYQIKIDDQTYDEGGRAYNIVVTVKEDELVDVEVTKNWGETKGGGSTLNIEGKTRTIKDIKISKLEE